MPRARSLLILAFAALTVGAAAPPAAMPLISYVTGRGEPTIVLVHGLGVDHTDWDRVVARLQVRHRVITVDLPGHGASAPLDSATVAGVARSLDRALEKRRVRRAILVGHSYGGLVAVEEAAASPGRVAGVIVVDCGLHTPVDPEHLAEMDDLLAHRYRIFVQAVFGLMSIDSVRSEGLVARAQSLPQPVLTAYFRDAWRADLRARVGEVRAPVLLIATSGLWPDGEPWESARGRLGYEKARALQVRRVRGSGHFVTLDQPDSLGAVIAEFAATTRR